MHEAGCLPSALRGRGEKGRGFGCLACLPACLLGPDPAAGVVWGGLEPGLAAAWIKRRVSGRFPGGGGRDAGWKAFRGDEPRDWLAGGGGLGMGGFRPAAPQDLTCCCKRECGNAGLTVLEEK